MSESAVVTVTTHGPWEDVLWLIGTTGLQSSYSLLNVVRLRALDAYKKKPVHSVLLIAKWVSLSQFAWQNNVTSGGTKGNILREMRGSLSVILLFAPTVNRNVWHGTGWFIIVHTVLAAKKYSSNVYETVCSNCLNFTFLSHDILTAWKILMYAAIEHN